MMLNKMCDELQPVQLVVDLLLLVNELSRDASRPAVDGAIRGDFTAINASALG